MSTLTTSWEPVASLYTCAQIRYAGRDWIALRVRVHPIGGWIVDALEVDDPSDHPDEVPLFYANNNGRVELVHRSLAGAL